jgi:hypothetical protein
MNLGANLAADAVLAIAIYLIVTQPRERKKSKQRVCLEVVHDRS